MTISRRITSLVYRLLVMVRHPESVVLRFRGVDYEEYRAFRQPWLTQIGIQTVLDIGANTGQFARLIHTVLPNSDVYSFEPLPDCFNKLKHALPKGAHFFPFNVALGEKNEDMDFYRAHHSPSSSFLEMTACHRESFPESGQGQVAEPLRVTVRRLDDVTKNLSLREKILIKMDVQGYEDKVMAGGCDTLARASVVIIETSFLTLYENQPLFDDVYRLLTDRGFAFQGNQRQMMSPGDGRFVGADSLFVRRPGVAPLAPNGSQIDPG